MVCLGIPKTLGDMRDSKSPKSAIKRLRGFGLAVGAMLLSAGMALFAFSGASSSADGSNSRVDYYLELNIGSTNNQYASHPEPGLLGGQTTVTWEAWIYPVDGTLNREAMFSKEGNFTLGLQGGELFAAFSDANGNNEITTTSGVRPPLNAWSHIAFVKSGTSVLIYLNGSEVINRANGAHATVRNAARELRIGNRENGERFKGRIDEVRIWETMARTEAQIQWGMHRKINPLTDLNASERSALIGYWDFNEPNSSTTAFARHTNFVRNLTLVNGPNRADVKQVSSAAGGDTVVTFPRTYLPGVAGWTVPQNALNFRALVVGGGGAGGTGQGGAAGGGGAGEHRDLATLSLTQGQIVSAVVGQGGVAPRTSGSGRPGQSSGIGSNSAAGGNGGQGPNGNNGGSGGNSGNGFTGGAHSFEGAGGGAGASQNGLPAADRPGAGASGGNGGAGASSSITGISVLRAGGGGGGGDSGNGAVRGIGGSGGGGQGGLGLASINSTAGEANSGSGGGGGGGLDSTGQPRFGSNGGSGVVIVRYTTTIDTALALTADSDHLASSSGLIPSVYTFEAWIRPTSFANSPMIYSQGGANGDSALWLSWQGNPQVEWGGTSYADIPSYTFPLNQWTHVAVSKDGSGVPRLFINSRNIWTGTANTGTFAGQFKIGQWWAHSGNDFVGDIDQVKIWSTTLGEDSLRSSMHSYSTSPVTQGAGHTLHAHYDMNDGEQEIELDRSGNGRHLSRISLSSASFSSSNIVVTGTAHAEQNFVRFNRSYLTANGGWTPPAGVSRFKALIVAGGGGGSRGSCSNWWGAGGGGGGVISSASFALPSNPTAVIVGQGGARSSAPDCFTVDGATATGQPGQPSIFGSITAAGGQPSTNASRNGAASGNGLAGATGDVLTSGGGGGAGGAAGLGGDPRNGGAGIASSIQGFSAKFGAGGPGRLNSNFGTYDGNVPLSNQLSHWDPNSGGGGADWTGGASGVVIVSWGSYLEVSRSPAVARAGSTFTQSIQVRQTNLGGALNTAPFQISVTASAWLTINGNPLTQSYTVTSNNGVADFTGLGFAANVPGPVTLNFFSDSFVGTSLVVTPTYFAAGVNILASGATTGHFFEGAFFASQSNTIATINRNDLVAHLASFSTVISSSDRIWVQTTVSSTATHSLTLRSATSISTSDGITVQTNNGDIVFWSDSDGNGVGLINIGQSGRINSANGRTGNGQTGGGRITLAGSFGNAGVDGAGHPLGAMADNSAHALQLRENSRLFSGGGNITIRVSGNVNSTSLGGEAFYQFGGSEVNSGTGQIFVSAISRNAANGFLTAGGSWISSATLSPAIEFLAQTAATNNEAFEQFNNTLLSVVSLGSASVGISMSAMVNASAPSMHATWLPSRIDLLSAQGDIQFTSNGHLRLVGLDPRHIASKPNSLVTSSSADVLIRAQALVEDNSNVSSSISTSGIVSFLPFASQFNATSTNNFAIEAGGFEFGNDATANSATNRIINSRDITTSGHVTISAQAVTITNGTDIVTTGLGSRVTLKAREWIDVEFGTTDLHSRFQTNNGDIIFWSDSDGNGTGSFYLGNFTEVNSANGLKSKTGSGGGRITMAGGFGNTGVDSAGHPLGAVSDTGTVNGQSDRVTALWIQSSVEVYSGGGDITLRSNSDQHNSAGIIQVDSIVWSGTGRISMSISQQLGNIAESRGLSLHNPKLISASTASPAIEIFTSNAGTAAALFSDANRIPEISSIASSGGGISISATTPSATNTPVSMAGWSILSRVGPIQITTNGVMSWATGAQRRLGAMAGSDVESSSANITIRTARMLDSTTNTNSLASTSGLVRILPFASNFSGDSTTQFQVLAGGFEFGNDSTVNTATHNILISSDITTSGHVTISAQTLTVLNGTDTVTTGLGSRITLKARDWIDIRTGTSATSHSRLQTNNGDIILWADSDGNSSGGIYLGTHNELNSANGAKSKTRSGGGRITIAGSNGNSGVDADGHPMGALADTMQSDGVPYNYALFLNTGSEIFSGGGDVTIRSLSDNGNDYAAYLNGTALIWSGAGEIRASFRHTALNNGLRIQDGSWISAATSSPAIEISTSTTGTGNYYGFYQLGATPFSLISLGETGGGISVSAMSQVATNQTFLMYGWDILSRAGDISITTNGYANWNTTAARNLGAKASSDVTSSSANILITANGLYDDEANNASKISTSGEVKFMPHGSVFALNYSVRFEIEAGTFEFGKIENVNSATNDVTFFRDVTSQGAMTVSARSISLNSGADLVTTENNRAVLLKARGDILTSDGSSTADAGHSRIQTNNGDIVLWVDSDGNSAGGVLLGNYTIVNSANGNTSAAAVSGGGDVVMAGGTAFDERGYPTGYAGNGFSALTDRSVHIRELSGIYTGGGDIYIRGRTNSSYGVVLYRGMEIFSGTGRIDIEGVSTATGSGYGVAFIDTQFSGHTAGPLTIVSAATSTPAIRLSGTTAGTAQGLRLFGNDAANIIQVASTATTGGGIDLSGRAAAAAVEDVHLFRAQVLSRNGAITVSAGVNRLSLDFSTNTGNNIYGSSPSSPYVTTSSADIALISDEWDFDSTGHQFNTSGDLSVLPFTSNHFGQDMPLAFATSTIKNLTIGKPPMVGGTHRVITITGTHSVSGEIKIHGGDVIVNGSSNFLRASSTISLIASANIQLLENLTTFGGNVWIQSRATGAAEGGVNVDSSLISSNGGDILISGGVNPLTDFAVGTAERTDNLGVNLGSAASIASGGGDIIIRGSQGADVDTDLGAGVYVSPGITIQSGVGDISLHGRLANQNNTALHGAVLLGNAANSANLQISSTDGDILIEGEASANPRNNKYGILGYPATITSTNGDVTVRGAGHQDNIGILGVSSVRSTHGSVRIYGFGSGGTSLGSLTHQAMREILVQDDQIDLVAATTFTGSASVTLQSSGSAFVSVPSLTNGTYHPGLSGLTLGRTSETGPWTLNKAVTINGPITVYGGTINIQEAHTITSASARATFKSRGDIITTAAGDVTTNGGPIILWSNADGNTVAGGRILVEPGSVMTSNGGDIVLGGGVAEDQSGYPAGRAKRQNGDAGRTIDMGGTLTSGAGNIMISAESFSGAGTNSSSAAIYVRPGGSLATTTGDISLSGVVAADNENNNHQWGVWIGQDSTLSTLQTGTGDIVINGDASGYLGTKTNRGGVVLFGSQLSSNTGDISLTGNTPNNGLPSGVTTDGAVVGWSVGANTVSTSGSVLISAGPSRWVDLQLMTIRATTELKILTDNIRLGGGSASLLSDNIVLDEAVGSTPGTARLTIPSGVTIQAASKDVTIGSDSVGQVQISNRLSVSGEVSLRGQNISVSAEVHSGGNTPSITMQADALEITHKVRAAGGDINVSANTTNRGIQLGGATTSPLMLVSGGSLAFAETQNLRVGLAGTENIYVGGDLNLTNVTNLVLRSAGNVIALNSAKIVVANIAVTAGGRIDLSGQNSVGGSVALVGPGGTSFSSAVSYSPAVVAGVTPVFGVGAAVSLTNSPSVQQSNRFLAVTFNPPPQILVTDAYQNVLDGNNRLAYQYTASASVASGSGTVTGLTASSRVGGNISFTAIKVTSNPGVYAFTLSAQIDPTTILSVRTGDFNVMGGEPGFLRINARTTSAAVGQTGLNFLVTVEDDSGNPIIAGDFANISVSAIVTGATIVSGGEVRAGDDGVATFSNLILNGSASSEVSISFKVTFNRLSDQQLTTVTSEETQVFLTHGTPTKMVISSDSQSKANRSTLSQVVVSLQDAFGNQVFNQSGQVTVSIGSGSGATLVGTTAVTLTAGSSEPAVATFSNLALQGAVGEYRLDFEYSVAGVNSVSNTVTLTHGAAAALVLDVAASGARAGIALAQQPRLTLKDVDGNVVPANASVSAAVDSATLVGTTQLELVDGYATFSGLVLTGASQMQSMTYEVTAPAGFTSFSTSQSLDLAPGVPYKLDFNATANDSKAGVIQTSARPIRLLDEWDNPTSQSSAVNVLVQVVSSSDTAQVNRTVGTYTIASGAISTNITLADTAVTLSGTYKFKLSATGLQAGFSNAFTITNAEANELVFVQTVPSSIRSGVSISPAVRLQVQDAFGNPVLDSTTSVSVSAVAGNVLQILGGVAENTLGSSFIDFPDLALIAKVGQAQLRFHASHLSAPINGGALTGAQFTVAFGLPHQLTVSPTAVTVANRENLGSITVQVLDSAENLVADAAVNVTAAVNGATLTGTPGAITSGGSFTYTDLAISGTAGDYDLDFTATGLVKATVEVTLGHGAAHNLVMQLDPQAKNAITMSAITVSIFDRDGNLVTTGPQSTQNVTLAGFGADLLGDDVVPAVGGIATFSNVALKGVIGDKTISASISLPTTITQEESVELGFGDPDRLDLTTTATGFVNRVPFFRAPVITVRDISNNVVPANGMDIRVSVASASISGSITTSAATGIATFASDLVLRGLVGSHDLVFTAEGTSSSGVVSASQTIALTHGSASQIVLTQTSSGALAGINFGFQPILELRDPEGNLVNTTAEASSGVVVSYTGPAWDADAKTGVDFTGNKNISFVNGVATFQNLRLSGQIGNYTLDYVSALNANIATSEVVQLEHGTADRIAVIQGPTDVVAGAAFTNTVQVELLDQFHNRAIRLTESATVVARLLNASNQNTIATSAEFGAQAGVVSFTGLNFTSAGSRYIQFERGTNSSTSNLIAVTTNVFTITHAAPSQIEWVYAPAASVMNDVAVAGANSASPVLIAKDQFNNVVDTGTVQISVHVTSGTVQQISGTQVSGVSGSAVVPALTLRALVGNYTLEFRASTVADPTVFDSISHVIEVTPGAANSIVATTHPTMARSSLAFVPQPVLEIRDTAGNRVSQSSDVVVVGIEGATLTGETSMQASAGIASFTNVKLAGSASNAVTLSYTIQGTNISTTSAIPLVAGVATEMKLEWTVTNIKTRGEITESPKIILLDEDGNKVITDQTTTASASLMRQGVIVTTSPTISTAVNGEILLEGLVFIARPDVAYHLRFDSDGLPSVSTSEFVVLPGPVEFVEIFVQPGSQLSGATTRTGEKLLRQPEIYLRDFDGNLVTTENGTTVSASIFSGAGGTILSASASVVDGIARFTELGIVGLVATPTQSAEVYKLEFSFGAITSSPSADLSVMHNVAHRISILTPAAGGRSGLDFETKPQVVVLDRYGNRVYQDNALNLTANPIVTSGTGTAAFSNNNTGSRNNQGVYTFNMGISGLVGNTYALNFVHNQGVAIAAQQTGITITHGLASKIGFLTLPNTLGPNQETTATGANLRIQPVIEIQDAVGNRVLDFTEDVVATIETAHRGNRDYLSGNSVSAVAGVATFQNLKMVVDPAQQYRLNFTFRQSSFVANIPLQVTHAAPEYLTISTSPLAGNKTGDALQRSPVLTVHDFDGNLTTAITGASVSAHITTGNGYVVQDGNHKALVQGGIAEFQQLKIVAPPGEAQRLTFRLDGFANSASATVSSEATANLSFTFGDAHKLVVNREPCTGSNCSIGRSGELMATQPIVEVQDFYGNRVTNHSGQVIVEAQGQGGFLLNDSTRIDSAVAQFASGLATFATLRLEGTPGVDYTLRFSSGNLLPTTSAVIQVRNNVAHSLVVTTQPVGGVTGELLATPPIVEMRDRFGNLVVDHVGADLQVTAIGPSRIGGFAPAVSSPGDGVFVGGVASFTNLRLTGLVNTDYVLQFSDGTRSITSNALQLSAAGAASIQLLNVPAADRTGDLLTVQPSLRVLDFDGNLAVSTSVTVTATVTGGGYIESGTTSSAVDGGYITFSSLVLVAPVGVPQQLTFTATTASGSFAVSTTTALVVRHTDTAYFEVLAPVVQGNFQQGAVLATQPKLQAFDRYGNPAISDNSTVLTASIGAGSGGAISGSATAQASGGVVQFAGLAVTGSPGVNYTLRFSANLGGAYFVDNTSTLTLFKTAALTLNYANTVYSANATISPTIAFTDSTENNPVYSSTTGTRCSVDPATAQVTILGAGDCTIVSTIANGTFYRANQISTTFTIAKADQTPVVITNANNVPFGQVLNLTAVGGSSTAQTRFFVDGTCRTMGSVLVPLSGATEGSPSCFLLAQRAGDANFKPYTTDEMPITVTRIPQQPLQIGNSLDTKVGNVELFTIGGSGNGEITYTVTLQTGTTCTIVGTTLSTNGSGNCEVMATKAQDQNHTLANSPAVVFTFSKQIQQLTFTSIPPSMPLPGQLYQASVTASSGLTVSYSITIGGGSPATSQSPAVPAVCALTQGNLGEIQFLRSGNCQLTATQSGNEAFGTATVAMLIQVGSLNQFITFPPMTDTVFGTPAFRLTAAASSELPVSYTTSAGITACSVNQGLVTLLAAGLCEIVASQAGDSTFAPAPNVSRVFRVLPDRASAPSLVSAAVGNQWFTLRYTQPSYNGGSPIIGYRLEVLDQGTNSAGVYVNSACSTTAPLTCTMVGLPNNRPYVARVAAITAAGVGLFSQYTSAMTPTNAEASVTQLFADVSANGLDLNWVAPLAFEGAFQRYEVFVWETGTQEPETASATVASSNSTAITIPQSSISNTASISQISNQGLTVIRPAMNLTNRLFVFGSNPTRPAGFISLASVQNQSTISATAEYSIKVVTITDTYTESMPVNTANGLKIGLSTPAAPTQLGLDTSDPSKMTVAWSPPLSDGGFPILDYQVVLNGERIICNNLPSRTCVISPLADSTTYNIQVMARNALGVGAAAVASHTTPTPPPPPVVETTGGGSGGFLPPISDASGARVPQFNTFTPSVVRPGQVVVVDGNKLDTITRVMLGGVDVNFVLISNTELHFVVPTTTKPGLYSVERFTDFGRYINRNAITVMGDPVSESIVVPNPVTQSPTTSVPVTPGPSTQSPVTPGPSTQSPVTPGPSTQSPVTPGPVTPGPSTQSPVTPGEEGEAPGTGEPGSGQAGSGSEGEAGSGSSTSSPGESDGSTGPGQTDGAEQVPPGGEGKTDSENVAIGENESEPVNPLIWIFLIAMLLAAGSYFALRRKGN